MERSLLVFWSVPARVEVIVWVEVVVEEEEEGLRVGV